MNRLLAPTLRKRNNQWYDNRFGWKLFVNSTENATLVISYIGYITQEIAVKGNANLNITLKEDSKALEEVVVIGYGTARKSDVTGSIASVGGDKLREMPATNITYALQIV